MNPRLTAGAGSLSVNFYLKTGAEMAAIEANKMNIERARREMKTAAESSHHVATELEDVPDSASAIDREWQ